MSTMPAAAQTIWLGEECLNQYAVFRREFQLSSPESATLLIAADTNYIVYVNGSEIGRGQYSDFPDRKTWTELPVNNLCAGKNVLAVFAWHPGDDSFIYMKTAAGIQFALQGEQLQILSDSQTKGCEHAGYRSGELPKRTYQIGFTSCFDARKFPADWMMPEFDDAQWPQTVAVSAWRADRQRPVPVCKLGALKAGKRVKQGSFLRTAPDSDNFSLLIEADEYHYTERMPELPQTGDNGIFAIYDLGEESVGFFTFEVEAPAGTVIDFAHGEHLDDGKVRAHIGDRSFADRHICSEGVNRYELKFQRIGGRFLQLNITQAQSPVVIRYAGIRPWDFPLPQAAAFLSDDLLQSPLRKVAQRTLEMCMHEHYEDCPWREQSMYAYDSRNQALYGYYLWGNYEFMRASFRLLGWSYPLRDDHLMMLCAPMVFYRTIPIFSYVWISAAYENHLYSGDNSLFEEFKPMIADIVAAASAHFVPENGLYHTGTDPKQWNFYEWSPDLFGDGCAPDEFHAGYNFYLIEMFDSYAKLLGPEAGAEYAAKADALRIAADKFFWNEAANAYASKKTGAQFHADHHDHMQLLALYTGVATGERAERVVATLFSEKLNYATLSALPYLVRAMMPISPAAREYVAQRIRKVYGRMVEQGATTLWETETGGWEFDNAGSLCHGWSSLPIYYQSGAVLGVTPLTPGFQKFQVQPYADKWTHFAAGSVPTPAGTIKVQWQRSGKGLALTVEHPNTLECLVADYPECPVHSIVVNGKIVK